VREHLEQIDKIAINAATLVSARRAAKRGHGLDPRPATRAERARMTSLLDEALDVGGIGLSSGLEYQPGCDAGVTARGELATVVGRYDEAYAAHIRNRGETRQ
jgi:N-acyl-D-aspartate/D-glutamate deacylase